MTSSLFSARGTKIGVCAVAGVGAVFALGACSKSNSDSTPTATATATAMPAPAPAPAGAVPAPPPGSTALGSGKAGGTNYKNASMTPPAVKNYYVNALQTTGYTIVKNTQGGGGGGGYGGAGAGVIASKDGTFVGVGAGGESGHPTYFSVCSGASQAAVNGCYDNDGNNSNSGGS